MVNSAFCPSRAVLAPRAAVRRVHRCSFALVCASTLAETQATPVVEQGEMTRFPPVPAVYAVYAKDGSLQYVGLSRKLDASIINHLDELSSDDVASVKHWALENPTREVLTNAWKQWVQEAVQEVGGVPPGNAPGEKKWQARQQRVVRPEIKLTPGKGVEDLTCSVVDLIEQVVKGNKVVAFVKGTRTQPECGFSFKVLTILNEVRADYEVVNVLDEVYNPGLRDAIKEYSMWPTIPQLYVEGEFVGGADIVEEMFQKGELQQLLTQAGAVTTAQ